MPEIPNNIGPVNKVRSDTVKRLSRDEHGRFFKKTKEGRQETRKNGDDLGTVLRKIAVAI